MKNLAKLLLFFSLSFIILLIAAAGFRFLILHVQWLRYLPHEAGDLISTITAALRWALSFAIYGSILLGLSYVARLKIFYPLAALFIIVLSLGISFGVLAGIKQLELIKTQPYTVKIPGESGLILNQLNSSVVLLEGPQEPQGPRIIAITGRPLQFNAGSGGSLGSGAAYNSLSSLPPLPIGSESPWLLKSIGIDLRLNAELLKESFNTGFISFLFTAGSLIFFLASLGFLFKLSVWSLANILIGAFAFRMILALERFFYSQEIQETFVSFTQNRLPAPFIVPSIFCIFGLLVCIYTLLVYLAKRRHNEEDFR